ncbi:MAG: GxxExxY protein [Bacteroidales bacterium]|nr:GxxExxY protein [Bacteroidales bacterium]MCF8388967.1 GxxExxY protein [Bacteroidales bacterium]
MPKKNTEKIASEIVDAAFHVHKEMGPGLLESVYQLCLMIELKSRAINFQSQFSIPLIYKGVILNKEFKVDFLVEQEILLELKSVESILPLHQAQIISYLKLSGKHGSPVILGGEQYLATQRSMSPCR